ncbi:uncharacterized protein [Antedon mediterranea]|uniref:uncharacterized protein n=1 Tax=Antedon mediterranea TaxID=105859 RepID=UPI003AF7A614
MASRVPHIDAPKSRPNSASGDGNESKSYVDFSTVDEDEDQYTQINEPRYENQPIPETSSEHFPKRLTTDVPKQPLQKELQDKLRQSAIFPGTTQLPCSGPTDRQQQEPDSPTPTESEQDTWDDEQNTTETYHNAIYDELKEPTCIKECEPLFNKMKSIHVRLRETREMYEFQTLFSDGEQKMFSHLYDIDSDLTSFIENLKYAFQDVVEVYKLLKYWLQERFFKCFEFYYLNQDIRQNLLSFVKEYRTDCHMLFQKLTFESNKEYSFTDLEERFKELNNWFDVLADHLQKLQEADVNSQTNTVSRLAHETQQLLKNTKARLNEKKKNANHSSGIIGQIELPKNERGIISQEVYSVLAEDYPEIQGIVLNVRMPKKSKYGRSDYSDSRVYLVVFEKNVLLTTMEEKKKSKSKPYKLLECCNRNYVDFERLPKKASPHPHAFILYFYKLERQSKTSYSTHKYVLAPTGNEVTHDVMDA